MAVRSRVRAILIPLFFYAVLGGASAYLIKNGSEGQNGAEARVAFEWESAGLKAQLADLEDQRERWRHACRFAAQRIRSTATCWSRRRARGSTA